MQSTMTAPDLALQEAVSRFPGGEHGDEGECRICNDDNYIMCADAALALVSDILASLRGRHEPLPSATDLLTWLWEQEYGPWTDGVQELARLWVEEQGVAQPGAQALVQWDHRTQRLGVLLEQSGSGWTVRYEDGEVEHLDRWDFRLIVPHWGPVLLGGVRGVEAAFEDGHCVAKVAGSVVARGDAAYVSRVVACVVHAIERGDKEVDIGSVA